MDVILVTGGAGFVGSNTCISLLKKKFKLIVLDSNINSSKISLERVIRIGEDLSLDFKRNLYFVKGDIRDQILLRKIFEKSLKDGEPIKAVIHFAGLKSVKESIIYPNIYWDVNFNGSVKLFECMEEYNCKNIVFSSSATIYGNTIQDYVNENIEIKPINPYGKTKAAVENKLKDIFHLSKSWRIANLRYFNPIGAHPSGLLGEDPKGIPNNLFPLICKVASGEMKYLSIFGTDWPTFDGTCVRDYIHIEDLSDAHAAALNFLLENKPQIINLNIGTGKGHSVYQVINHFEIVNKCKISISLSQRRSGDVPILVADNSLALELLEWRPKYNLEDMCRDGFRWKFFNQKSFESDKKYQVPNYFSRLE